MRQVLLGNTGLRVSEIALGTMTFGTEWGYGVPAERARQIFDQYAELGGNFIDTAVNYTDGTSETLIGEFLRGQRERFVVATKFGYSTDQTTANAGGTHRRALRQAVDLSLRRLGLDYIDVLYLHFWDHHTPLDETVRALDDLVRSGRVLYTGISDCPAWVVARAQTLAEERGHSPFCVVQAPYSLLDRTPETELLPAADALGLTVAAFGVLGAGVLTGKYTESPGASGRLTTQGRALSERERTIAAAVADVAKRVGATPSQVATAWAMRHRNVVPVVGATSPGQIAEVVGAATLTLDDEALAVLAEVSAPPPAYPTAMLRWARPVFLGPTFANTRDARRPGVLPGQ
ncbi:MAG: aldo/keto reductase [Frankia sp.]|nr:aldo/keto reductase [Frankia sp.]